MANLYTLSKKSGKRIVYTDKKELLNENKLLTDEELCKYFKPRRDDGISIGYPEIQPWINLVHYRMFTKAKKTYKSDVLLIDDHHMITYTNDLYMLERAIYMLFEKFKTEPIIQNSFKKVIIDNPIGLLLLYNPLNWKYKLKIKPYLYDELED